MWLLRLSATKPYVFTIHFVIAFHFIVANDLTFHQLVAIDKSYVFTIDRTFHQLVAVDQHLLLYLCTSL